MKNSITLKLKGSKDIESIFNLIDVDGHEEFYAMEVDVTQELFEAVMGHNPSHFKDRGDQLPVESVTQQDCIDFAIALKDHLSPESLRLLDEESLVPALPTEEDYLLFSYGTTEPDTDYPHGNKISHKDANYGNKNKGPVQVYSYRPNSFGIFQAIGNVWKRLADKAGQDNAEIARAWKR